MMAFTRLVVLSVFVVMLMTEVLAGKGEKKKKVKYSKIDGAAFDELQSRVEALEKQSGGSSGNNVHFYFHGDGDHSHHDDGDAHVHVDVHVSDNDHGHGSHGEDGHVHHDHIAFCRMDDKIADGTVTIYQGDHDRSASFHFHYNKLAHENSEFEFHVHQYGDLSDDCANVGGHYDPYHDNDVGDLGTLQSGKDGAMDAWKNETHLTLFGEYSIVGRSIMVHDEHKHVSCCTIGWSPETHDHHEDHSHAHDHDHSAHDHSAHDHSHTDGHSHRH
ncbi:histidine-rich glycoprotein-like [Ruditapes philippinarum]|uniref:histidine-rich glycoprotein-like n=1 Tax=Ruditapes philippinarum TaxID=129788 RepID=UPI00295C270B|nr:histidine-rich glycoprotein-like [Ruditapes philippinarum]